MRARVWDVFKNEGFLSLTVFVNEYIRDFMYIHIRKLHLLIHIRAFTCAVFKQDILNVHVCVFMCSNKHIYLFYVCVSVCEIVTSV